MNISIRCVAGIAASATLGFLLRPVSPAMPPSSTPRTRPSASEAIPAPAQPADKAIRPSGGRIASIDALRGFDLCWIVGAGTLVQSLAHVFPDEFTAWVDRQLEHVRWEGFHFYDLIYPLFIFLVGTSIVFSLDKARNQAPKRVLVARILRRGLGLYFLNFIFNGGFSARWPQMRVTSGVLALIAAAYVIAALLYLFLAHRLKIMAVITAGLLLGYWALLALTPFPDFHLDRKTVAELAATAGSSSPAAIARLVPARISGVYEEGHNFSNYVDFRFIPGRMLNGYYESQGLLSPITAAAVCLMGVFAARLLLLPSVDPTRKALILAACGASAVALGALWGLEFPIVKKLWSSSFCLVAAGCSCLLLAAFYFVVDVWERRSWCQPFIWIGTNSILLYLLSALVDFPRIAVRLVGGDVGDFLDRHLPGSSAVAVALVALLIVMLLARFLYQRRIFLRV
jgi:predicted acyltransferase